MYENRIWRTAFGPQGEDVAEDGRKVLNEGSLALFFHHILCCSDDYNKDECDDRGM
jgi:hypothetical protein